MSAPDWKEEARRLIDSGMPVKHAAAAVGKHESTIRVALDINGAKERRASWRTLNRVKSEAKDKKRERPVLGSYRAEPVARPLTLPKLSIQSLPDEDKREIKFAPKVRVRDEDPGVTRLREIHRAMIRDGRLPDPALRNLVTH